MGTITQTAPVTDTVDEGVSAGYTNQLQGSGAAGAITYVTTSESVGLLVFAGGALTTTGDLGVGSYTVSGTSSDASSNTGTWSFTLTVTSLINAEVSVTPSIQALPTGTEILVPFQIDSATGAVAVVTDYVAILEQHIATICMTNQGERVMFPTYGGGLEGEVFQPAVPTALAILQSDIQTQIQKWEPGVKVQGVKVTSSPSTPNLVSVVVVFSVVPYSSLSKVAITVGGTITNASAP